jgi:opacity protein-like surface antigen
MAALRKFAFLPVTGSGPLSSFGVGKYIMKLFAFAAVAALSLASPAVGQELVGSEVQFAHQFGGATFSPSTQTVENGPADTATITLNTTGYTANLDASSLTVDFFAPPTTPCLGRFCIPSDNVFLSGAGLLISSSEFDFASIIAGMTITNTGGFGFTADRVSYSAEGIFFDFGNLDYTNDSGFTANFASVAAVPEPGTWAMMLLGFGGMGIALRRRRKPSNIAQLA